MDGKINTLADLLKKPLTAEDVGMIHYILDYYLRKLHNENKFVSKISFNTILVKQGRLIFSDIGYMNVNNNQTYINKNIDELNKTMIGAYHYINSKNSDLPASLKDCDYALFIDYDPSFLKANNLIKDIPEDIRDYFTEYIDNRNNGNFTYYSKYLDNKNKNNESIGKSNNKGISKVKSTPYGKLYSDNEENGLANVLIYPLLTVAFLVLIICIYFLYNYIS